MKLAAAAADAVAVVLFDGSFLISADLPPLDMISLATRSPPPPLPPPPLVGFVGRRLVDGEDDNDEVDEDEV